MEMIVTKQKLNPVSLVKAGLLFSTDPGHVDIFNWRVKTLKDEAMSNHLIPVSKHVRKIFV